MPKEIQGETPSFEEVSENEGGYMEKDLIDSSKERNETIDRGIIIGEEKVKKSEELAIITNEKIEKQIAELNVQFSQYRADRHCNIFVIEIKDGQESQLYAAPEIRARKKNGKIEIVLSQGIAVGHNRGVSRRRSAGLEEIVSIAARMRGDRGDITLWESAGK